VFLLQLPPIRGNLRANSPVLWHVASTRGSPAPCAYKYASKRPENCRAEKSESFFSLGFSLGFSFFSFSFSFSCIFSFFVDLGLGLERFL